MPKLTERSVAHLPLPVRGQKVYGDHVVKGLMIVCGVSSRSFTVQYEMPAPETRRGSKTSRKTIGRVGEIDLKDARAQARLIQAEAHAGRRTIINRSDKVTLRQGWALHRSEMERAERRPRTIELYRDCIERLLGDWLDEPMENLTRQRCRARHQELTDNNGPYAANRALGALKSVWNEAALDHDLPANPMHFRFNKEHRRDTALHDDELPIWFEQWGDLPNATRRCFHLFLLLSGQRPGAAKTMRWEHVDWDRRIVHFPRTKTTPFELPFGEHLGRTLRAARYHGNIEAAGDEAMREWVFPANRSPAGHIVTIGEKRRPIVGYALRHTWTSTAAKLGIDGTLQSLVLNHSAGSSMTAGYITGTVLEEPVREALDRVGAHLLSFAPDELHQHTLAEIHSAANLR